MGESPRVRNVVEKAADVADPSEELAFHREGRNALARGAVDLVAFAINKPLMP